MLRPIGGLRASPGSDRITEYGAPRVREYLDENVVRKVVGELASFAGVSSNHLIATFGVPPHCGELPIAEVACLAGSSDQSHLAVALKKYRARTPTGAGHASLKN
ncbi:AraC family transcriptional regulator [Mesorhizobium sp. M7A.F.Ca.US.011.01.1.1]|uniref:helix-turn-helix domain-containing protein n=1 Tax=Mesorhizobium sp. M7A.F.Ca.US.011.01.1.1 TaxID=2496741 RepID=UPI001FE012E9|nr:AraC family transcriptional regulator [Mesorhizobium sp. M7A.F.Ca.US.011.01.1.1]